MSHKFAAIDIGSNSSLLLILELTDDGTARVIIDTKASTKLSSGTQYGAAIGEDALKRQFRALDKFADVLKEHQVGNVAACGTQVFRAASNGRDVARTISQRYGWRMEIISGEREAELSYRAATIGLSGICDARIVIDVGGGSSEVIFGQGDQIVQSRSFPVGAVSLTERFGLEGERIDGQNLHQAREYLDELFSAKDALQFLTASMIRDYAASEVHAKRRDVVAVGGTASTMAAISLEQKIFNPRAIHGVKLTSTWVEDKIATLCVLTTSRRRELMPFDPDRAEIILGGALIISVLLNKFGATQMAVSNCGLRWGLIIDSFPSLQAARIEQ